MNSRDLRTLRETVRGEHLLHRRPDVAEHQGPQRRHPLARAGQPQRRRSSGLRVDMARYTTGQTLVGLSTIVLDNLWQDDAMIRERLAFTLFERLGLRGAARVVLPAVHQQRVPGPVRDHRGDRRRLRARVTGETDGTVFEYHCGSRLARRRSRRSSPTTSRCSRRGRTVLDADSTLYNPIQAAGPRDQRPGRRGLARARGAVHRSQPVHDARRRSRVHRRERRAARLRRHEQLLSLPAARGPTSHRVFAVGQGQRVHVHRQSRSRRPTPTSCSAARWGTPIFGRFTSRPRSRRRASRRPTASSRSRSSG